MVASLCRAAFGEMQSQSDNSWYAPGKKVEELPWGLRLFWAVFLHHKYCELLLVIIAHQLLW